MNCSIVRLRKDFFQLKMIFFQISRLLEVWHNKHAASFPQIHQLRTLCRFTFVCFSDLSNPCPVSCSNHDSSKALVLRKSQSSPHPQYSHHAQEIESLVSSQESHIALDCHGHPETFK